MVTDVAGGVTVVLDEVDELKRFEKNDAMIAPYFADGDG